MNRNHTSASEQHDLRVTTPRKRRTYSAEFKAKVVLDWLDGKRSLPEIATEHHLHPNQIKNWKCTLRKRLSSIFEDKRGVSRAKRKPDPTPVKDSSSINGTDFTA